MKISQEDYRTFVFNYTYNKYPHQRFGQAFCNHFNITDSEVFYEENFDKSSKLIEYKYL